MTEYPFKDLLPLDEVLEREGYYKDWTHLDPEVFYSLTQISEYIKTKGYGVDVRLLIAQLAEHFSLKTTQVVDLANLLQQKFENLEGATESFTDNIKSLATQMEADKNTIVANATVDSEVILARGDKPTLRDRLDETTTQLTQNTKKLRNDTTTLSSGVRESSPTVVFISDDASVEDYTRLKPIFDSKDVRFGIGVVTSFRSSAYMTWEQIQEMKNQGYEIMAHSHTHVDLAAMSKPQLTEEIETMLSILEEKGHYPDSFIYPFNSYSLDSIDVMQKYFKYAFARTRTNASISGNNFPIIDNQRIARVGFGSYFDTWRTGYPSDTTSLEYYKARVDEAVANNSLIAFVMHPWAPEHTETQQQHLSDLIDYVKSIGVPILLPTEAMQKHGNAIQIGSQYTPNKFWVDNEGEIDSTSLKVVFDEENSRTISTPVTKYPIGKISYTPISRGYAQSQLFPRLRGGVLITTIFKRSATYYVLQEYIVTEDGSFEKFVRKDVGGGWGEFEPDTKSMLVGGDNFLAFTNDSTTVPRLFTSSGTSIRRLTHTISEDGVVTFTISEEGSAYYRPSNTTFSVGDDIPAGDYILNGRMKTGGATLEISLWVEEPDGIHRPHYSDTFESSANFIDFSFRFNIDGSYPTYILSLEVLGDTGATLSLRDLALRRGNVEVAYSPRLQS